MNGAREYLADLARAFALLTRLPIRAEFEGAPLARAAWAYPVVGAFVGVLVMLVGLAASWAGIPPLAASLLAVALGIVITGAMHEDGWADTADGLWGAWTKERRLEIMRDSRIGAYGVLALAIGIGLRTVLLAEVIVAAPLNIIGIAALSRAGMSVVMAGLPHARDDGLSHITGRPSAKVAVLAVVAACAVALVTSGLASVAILLACACAVFFASSVAQTKIGGQTGDILGATQVLCELFALMAVVALLD